MQFFEASLSLLFSFLVFSCHLTAPVNGGNVPASYILGDVAINCGCLFNSTTLDGRLWVGETNLLQPKGNSKISASNSLAADPTPYTTARVSSTSFYYMFRVNPGQKFIRLHFYPVTYHGFRKSRDLFTVKANSFTLLQNFTASITADSLGVRYFVKEFCLNVNESGNLRISFLASHKTSKTDNFHAFINGIEIISMPAGLYYTPDDNLGAPRVVGQSDLLYYVDNSTALELIQRLNIGGRSISPAEDTGMFRRWNEDADYGLEQMNSFVPIIEEMITLSLFIAPPQIYQTSRKLRKSLKTEGEHPFTWKVRVDIGFAYLVRLHFCHLGANSPQDSQKDFDIVIQNVVAETQASVIRWSAGNRMPVYRDYVVMMKGDRFEGKRELSISLQSDDGFVVELLKGLEIFKLSSLENSLASPTPPCSRRTSSLGTSGFQEIVTFGQSYSIMTALTILFAIINIVVYKLRRICEYNLWRLRGMQFAPNETSCREFLLKEVLSATQNFNDALIIGKGGFGKVYKGFIPGSGELLAIKRLKRDSKQGAREFWREIVTLSKVRHTNLVSLIGYCDEGEEMILVYEYMPRGTLADNLYKNDRKGKAGIPLSWEQRLRICIGAARGLDYLHDNTRCGVIHRDVKDTNILLDENFVAKISDFGLSKLKKMGETQGEFSTKVKGTIGYIDPEYLMTRKPSTRSDVYGFGMVLLVVLSGRPAVEIGLSGETQSLLFWFRECITKGDTNEVIHPSLRAEILTESLTTFIEIVEKCLYHQPKQRPSMAQVVDQLEHALEKQLGILSCIPCDKTIDPPVCPAGSSQTFEFYESKVPLIPDENSVSPPEEGNSSKATQNANFQTRAEGLQSREKACKPTERNYLAFSTGHVFSLEDITTATHNFSDEFLILKRKSYQLYRVFTSNGSGAVVIKRMNSSSRGAKRDFQKQVGLLDRLQQHTNVVSLMGYCDEYNELILVYEHMSTLDNILYRKNRNREDDFRLTWEQRLRVCRDVALGLEHLHKASVIHGDVNISNIMLDENFVPKVSGFGKTPGLPKGGMKETLTLFLYTVTDSHDVYMDPFTAALGICTNASDVYSFGIILLVILSGRPPFDHALPAQQQYLKSWFETCSESRSFDQIIDPNLEGVVSSASLRKFVELTKKCFLPELSFRPVMAQVVSSLNKALDLATKRAYMRRWVRKNRSKD